MSPDRIVYSFVLGWVLLIAVLIALDWLGNPNRGGFRPKGERPVRNRRERRSARVRRKLENDAAIRATLRDAYGASSLRLTWSGKQEDRVRQVDDALVVADVEEEVVDTTAREVIVLDHSAIIGDPLPNLNEVVADESESTSELAPESDPDQVAVAIGWKLGGDPLALTLKGTAPAPATIRSRVWKNHGAIGAWDGDTLARLRAGKPPRRTNPITGRAERATVDLLTGQATWGSDPTDPFAAPT